MQVEFVEPFIKTVFCALAVMTEQEPERGALSMRSLYATAHQVTIVFDVSGDISGKVLYGMSLVTAQKMAYALIGKPMKEMDNLAWSALAEIGNIMSSNALQSLVSAGFNCEIASASVIRGVGVEVLADVPALAVPVATKFGRVEIDIALEQQALPTA